MGDITGTAIFLETAENQATVTAAFFTGSSVNNGNIIENSYFYNTASNGVSGNVSTVSFFNSSTNTGTLTGTSNFINTSQNNGTIVGISTFGDASTNSGVISSTQQVAFLGSAINTGTVDTALPVIFGNTSVNAGTAYKVQFEDTSINTGAVLISAIFTENTNNTGSVNAGIFQGTSTNTGTVIVSATFTGQSTNTGLIVGNAAFLDTSSNTGSVSGDAAFTGDASNLGIVYGNAEFQADVLTDDDPDPDLDFIQLDNELDFLLVSDGDIATGIVSGEAISLTSVQLVSAAALRNITINGVQVSIGTEDLYNVAGSIISLNINFYPSNTEIYNDNIYSYRSNGSGNYYTAPSTRKKWSTSIGDIYTDVFAVTLANNIAYTNDTLTVLLASTTFTYGGIDYQTDSAGLITVIT